MKSRIVQNKLKQYLFILITMCCLSPFSLFADTYSYNLSDCNLYLWDLSGTYTDHLLGMDVIYDLNQDEKGKLSGSVDINSYDADDGLQIEMTLNLKGTLKQKNGVATVKMILKGKGTANDGSNEYKLSYLKKTIGMIDPDLLIIKGVATEKVSIKGFHSRKETSNFSMPLPVGMDGSSTLFIKINEVGKKLVGASALELSNNRTFIFSNTGKYNPKKNARKLSFKGDGCKINSEIGYDSSLLSIKGAVLGQKFSKANISTSPSQLFDGCILKGKVSDKNRVGMPGVTVTLGGATDMTTTTDGEGEYQFGKLNDMLPTGSYTITPSKSGYNFTPFNKFVKTTAQIPGDSGDIPWPIVDADFVIEINIFPTDENVVPEVDNIISVDLKDGRTIEVAEGRILVDFSDDATIYNYYEFEIFIESNNATIIGQITKSKCLIVQASSGTALDKLISDINNLYYIEYATYDRIYAQQNSNDIPKFMPGDWWVEEIELQKAWDFLKQLNKPLGKESIAIGIVDGGIGNQRKFFDLLDGNLRIVQIGISYRVDSHGTAVTALAAADSRDVVGVAPDTPIISFSTLNSFGIKPLSSVRNGIEKCIDAGAKIINVSYGGKVYFEDLKDFRWDIRKSVKQVAKNNCLLVLAEGNFYPDDPDHPVNNLNDNSYFGNKGRSSTRIKYEKYYRSNVIIVSGTSKDTSDKDNPLYFQYGIVTTLAAPAVGVTIVNQFGNIDNEDNGTSYAAPMVSGAAALLLAYDDTLTPQEIIEILETTGEECTHFKKNSYKGEIKSLNIYNALYYAHSINDSEGSAEDIIEFFNDIELAENSNDINLYMERMSNEVLYYGMDYNCIRQVLKNNFDNGVLENNKTQVNSVLYETIDGNQFARVNYTTTKDFINNEYIYEITEDKILILEDNKWKSYGNRVECQDPEVLEAHTADGRGAYGLINPKSTFTSSDYAFMVVGLVCHRKGSILTVHFISPRGNEVYKRTQDYSIFGDYSDCSKHTFNFYHGMFIEGYEEELRRYQGTWHIDIKVDGTLLKRLDFTYQDNSNPQITWYKDSDGDGYSDGTTTTSTSKPVNYYKGDDLIRTSGDCNDHNSNSYPGAPELCGDNEDNDCDGKINEGCGTTITWYKDNDRDGYSDGTTTTSTSKPLIYYKADELIRTSGDCNDYNANSYPGAPEFCGDDEDNDCDGKINEGCGTNGVEDYVGTYSGTIIIDSGFPSSSVNESLFGSYNCTVTVASPKLLIEKQYRCDIYVTRILGGGTFSTSYGALYEDGRFVANLNDGGSVVTGMISGNNMSLDYIENYSGAIYLSYDNQLTK